MVVCRFWRGDAWFSSGDCVVKTKRFFDDGLKKRTGFECISLMMGFQKRCSEEKNSKDERWSGYLFETSCCILGRRASISLLLTCLSPIASLSHLLFYSSSLVPIGPRPRGLLKTILRCRLSSTNRGNSSRGQNIYNLPDGLFNYAALN